MNKNKPLVYFFYFMSVMVPININIWFNVWVLLEMNTLTFVAMLMILNPPTFIEKTLCYFIIQTMSSLTLIVSLYSQFFNSVMMVTNMILILAVFLKMGAAPMHGWFIYVAAYTQWNSLMFIMTTQKIIPLIFLELWGSHIFSILLFLTTISCLMGTTLNFSSTSMKNMVIYSSVSTSGWLILCSLMNNKMWKIYLTIYIFNLCVLFSNNMKSTKNNKKNIIFFLTLMSIGGIPPLLGFFPKFFIMVELMQLETFLVGLLLMMLSVSDIFIFSKNTMKPLTEKSTEKKWNNWNFKPKLSLFMVMNATIMMLVM